MRSTAKYWNHRIFIMKKLRYYSFFIPWHLKLNFLWNFMITMNFVQRTRFPCKFTDKSKFIFFEIFLQKLNNSMKRPIYSFGHFKTYILSLTLHLLYTPRSFLALLQKKKQFSIFLLKVSWNTSGQRAFFCIFYKFQNILKRDEIKIRMKVQLEFSENTKYHKIFNPLFSL